MLHQFTFKNFKSFKDETTLDLTASAIKEHPNDVVNDVHDEKVLKVAAIYGANASGKSNVIKAFQSMRLRVLTSFKANDFLLGMENTPHWFEEETVPSEFSVLFSTAGKNYQYSFSVLKEKIVEESLYMRDPKLKKEAYITLLEREGNQFSGELLNLTESAVISELVEDDILLVSVLAKFKIDFIQDVYNWFESVRVVDYGNPYLERVAHYSTTKGKMQPLKTLIEDPKENEQLTDFIRAIDVGIDHLGVIGNEVQHLVSENEFMETKRIVSYHKNPRTGKTITTPIEDESSGTLKMLNLYVDMKKTLDIGGTIFIDEMDAKLHPLLIRYIIILFHNPKTNPKHAQLIFSTQEVFTLDKDNLRRDEIWFTDKDEFGCSELYSLVDYVDDEQRKVRNDASYGKDYILGRYKSVPSLKRWEGLDG
ncbi:AAA family ATPase [Enterococcus sp. 669A]|uniref:AAA family ATPase n=1 Tax=Candidatus Enterococcus moelleringii TaxID=2815325 RepID=A0ABS3LB52_9ENTE|nr:ATP-binding protein [Enterococcus sp. 669A]MBO1306846.1 AAA family ATPase [Enterococcus sp. 669A]